MRFLLNGPEVPNELVAAQERGEVMFVCGAGVSCTAGLKTFGGLVEQVYTYLGEDWNLHIAEREGMRPDGVLAGQYDRVLRSLERRLISSDIRRSVAMRELIRAAVRHALDSPSGVALPNHLALLKLSRDGEGNIRLLTTNFETLFERAWFEEHSTPIPTHAGLAMPQPKSAGCVGVLHLHGRLADPDTRLKIADDTSLVLTSAEFGDAYLRSGWASRYIYDVARVYTLVLVGYEANDPPMRYLLEALEADRERFSDLRKVFAFAPSPRGEEETQRALWRAKGVEPIPYIVEGSDHSSLYGTVQEWCRYAADPTAWRRRYLRGPLSETPSSLEATSLEECIDLLKHSDASTILGELSPRPDWMPALQAAGVFDQRNNEPGEWIATQVNSPDMIRACAALNSIPPNSRDWISRAIDKERNSIPAIRQQAWEILLSVKRNELHPDFDDHWLSVLPRVQRGETGYDTRRLVARLLQPHLTVGKPLGLPGEPENASEPERLSHLIRMDFESADYPSPGEVLQAWPQDRDAELALLKTLNRALLDSLEQASDLGFLDGYDRTAFDVPSVAPHQQNEYRAGFYPIVRSLADLWSRLSNKDNSEAIRIAQYWRDYGFLLTSRLWLYAIASPIFTPTLAAEAVLGLDDETFWQSAASVEIMRLLISRWDQFTETSRDSLEGRVRAGISAALFGHEELKEDEWKSVHDYSIFRRLKRIELSGGKLMRESTDILAEIHGRHPLWRSGPGDRDDFHSWHESRVGPSGNAELLAHIADKDLVREAMRLQSERRYDQGDLWRVFSAADTDRAFIGLLSDADRGVWNATAWRDMLWAAGDKDSIPLTSGVATSLMLMPDGAFLNLVPYSLTWFQRQRQKVSDPAFAGPTFFAIWDRFANLAFLPGAYSDIESDRDPLDQFLGSLGGRLTSVLVDEVSASEPQRGAGLDQSVSTRFARVLSSRSGSGLMGRLQLAREMAFIDWVDERWVKDNLAPLFSWSHSEALPMWRSYSQGRLSSAPLFNALKPEMLQAIERTDLGDSEIEGLISKLLTIVLDHQVGDRRDYLLTTAEFRRALSVASAAARRNVSWNLWHEMRAPDSGTTNKALHWNEVVGPVFREIWPLDADLRTEQSSKNLTRMALESGEALPDAVHTIRDYLVPYQLHELSHSFGLDRLSEVSGSQHVSALVSLVNVLVDTKYPLPHDLARFLDICVKIYPRIVEDPAYLRLHSLRRGLDS